MELYCSGLLLRTAGLIKENIGQFSGDAKSQLSQVVSHLDSNGTLLLDRATKTTGFTVSAKGIAAIGVNYADKQIGNNVMVAIQSGTEQHTAILNCLKIAAINMPTTSNSSSASSTTTPLKITENSFRKENEEKILRVYDLMRKNVEKINNSGDKISDVERAKRVYSFLVNKKGDGFWFASACQASYDLQLAYNKSIRQRGEKNILWEDRLLEQKKSFYAAILKKNLELIGESQFNASFSLAQKEADVYFYALKENGRETLILEKLHEYVSQCNRLSEVFDHRELPSLPLEEKNIPKESKPSESSTNLNKNDVAEKKLDRKKINQKAEEGCTQLIKQSYEKNGNDDYGRKIQQNFVQIFPTGPYGPGKYGENYFFAFNLALNKGDRILEFAVDCIFDSDGNVLGTEYRK